MSFFPGSGSDPEKKESIWSKINGRVLSCFICNELVVHMHEVCQTNHFSVILTFDALNYNEFTRNTQPTIAGSILPVCSTVFYDSGMSSGRIFGHFT